MSFINLNFSILIKFILFYLILISSNFVFAESVDVKYRGIVNLNKFNCSEINSSLVNRICYDRKNKYMLISLRGIYYHYCGIEYNDVKLLIEADSVGRFYNEYIKKNYDCRIIGIPKD